MRSIEQIESKDSVAAREVLETIRAEMAGFSPSERKVARALLAGPPTIGLEPSARLASQAGVSGPTVIRFANRLGFARYGDFQDTLRGELGARLLSPVARYAEQSGRSRPAEQGMSPSVADTLSTVVADSLRDLPPDELRRAVALLGDQRRTVTVFGGWFSSVLGQYLAAMLQEMRSGVRYVGHTSRERTVAIMEARAKDVAVVFDYRRYDESTVEFARAQHDAGATLVLLTDRWLSPISDIADVVLPTAGETYSPFVTLTPAMAIVEVLAVGIINSGGDRVTSRFERFNAVADRLDPRWGVATEDDEAAASPRVGPRPKRRS